MDQTRWTNLNTLSGGGRGDNGGDSRGQNSNFTNNAWNNWDTSTTTTSVPRVPEASVFHALLFGVTNTTAFHHGASSDAHMMCLKLGKRQYYEDAVAGDRHVRSVGSSSSNKRAAGGLSICQVDECHVALGNVKEYYRRHKVCEKHSKAPNVVVSGVQQRFCQQCSRFHDVIEFDEAKRSCRRRLEGHNLRRRKGTLPTSLSRNFPHSHESNSMMKQRSGPLSTLPPSLSPSSSQSKPVCALSLLSSPKAEPWISSGDLSSRCSAALYELIAANRATYVSGHFLNQTSSHQQNSDNTMHTLHDTQTWDRFTYNHDA